MFIDYNLFGMNFIDVDAVKFRRPVPDIGDVNDITATIGELRNLNCHHRDVISASNLIRLFCVFGAICGVH